MKKIIILALAAFALYSCNNRGRTVEQTTTPVTTENVDRAHNSRNSLDYKGTYKGQLPAADASGMDVTITLKDDTYTKDVEYVGKKGSFHQEGRYTWNADGSIITLEGIPNTEPNKYMVGENQLISLDMEGRRISGENADRYILRKQ